MPPLVKDYTMSQKVAIILGSNDCVYFYNTQMRQLVGTRLYNKRHHGATRVSVNPVMTNYLAVFGGPNGLVVYDLVSPAHFRDEEFYEAKRKAEEIKREQLEERNHRRKMGTHQQYQIYFTKNAALYSEAVWSPTGRYLACIKNQEVEIFDFWRRDQQSISKPIPFSLGLT